MFEKNVNKSGIFYTARYNLIYSVDSGCEKELNVSCAVGATNVLNEEKGKGNCKDGKILSQN